MENPNHFDPITPEELIDILGITIKKDEENKLITFLCQLSAYTENDQFNISFNAPSSSGKSYIPSEIARLFPEVDVLEIGYCSPTAFFHDVGDYNKEKNGYDVDLSRKIIIFQDQPHNMLLERLRPLLSHDKKTIQIKITDKSQKAGLKTKNVFVKGYPAVVFCSAGLNIDEQEGTRFLLLSPETNEEKLREGILEKISKDTNSRIYSEKLEQNEKRTSLKNRISAIKDANIQSIVIEDGKPIEEAFLQGKHRLKPRHMRDVGRLMSIIKIFALLNMWQRKVIDGTVYANNEDIKNALKIWEVLSESQEYNLPPYIYDIYMDVIVPAFEEKNKDAIDIKGLSRKEIARKHYQVYCRMMPDWQLRQQAIPMLETAGLIYQDTGTDKRSIVVFPTYIENSELGGGVNTAEENEMTTDKIVNTDENVEIIDIDKINF